jgi:hypothetical protein
VFAGHSFLQNGAVIRPASRHFEETLVKAVRGIALWHQKGQMNENE